ncbi:hypothetical protein MA16_Dca017736 [Dendrobium catenatum]|uniref:Uncharacterized protein n=1 Tax=Dendrobium catenatum TaxID=906689 RepID=A0A2I0VY88_9ASPA|nr:hypothetical protein MA16_Dca017736 [Dendrobium catenatum]
MSTKCPADAAEVSPIMDFRSMEEAWNPTRYTPSKDSPTSSQLQDMYVDARQELRCEIRTAMRAKIDGDKLLKMISAVLVAVAGQELRCGSQGSFVKLNAIFNELLSKAVMAGKSGFSLPETDT